MNQKPFSHSAGGEDPEQRLIRKIVAEISREYNLDIAQDSAAIERIREEVEAARMRLETHPQTEINLPSITAASSGPIHYQRIVTREDFSPQTANSEKQGKPLDQQRGSSRIGQTNRQPVVTISLLVITISIYMLQLLTQYVVVGFDVPAAFGLKVNALIENGQYWRLVTPMLLHGSILHIGFNMYALYMLGRRVERFFGSFRFLGLYLIAGITGNVFSFYFTPSPSLGSSTAIFGLLGAEGVFIYQHRNLIGDQFQVALRQIIQVAVVNLLIGLSPGIDNWGHVGGLIGGAVFSWFAGPLLTIQDLQGQLRLKDNRTKISQGVVFFLQVMVLIGLVAVMILNRG
jgi:rhomboid protease GluP